MDKPEPPYHDPVKWYGSMTKREWFAGQALAGLLARADFKLFCGDEMQEDLAAINAFKIADAMLAASQHPAASVNAALLAALRAVQEWFDSCEELYGHEAAQAQVDAALAAAEPV